MRRSTLIAAGAVFAAALTLTACSSDSVGSGSTGSGGSETTASTGSGATGEEFVAEARALVDAAGGTGKGFTPPEGGPVAQDAAGPVVYIAADLTNGGINTVGEAIQEAAGVIGWDVTVLDGKASAQGRTEAISQAIAMNPPGIILGGFDAKEQASSVKQATDAGIPVVSWHAGPTAGPMDEYGVLVNVTTDAVEVAELAAAYAVADSDGTAGVAIFTDQQYEIAVSKSDAIEAYIERCEKCTVLAYENSPIASPTPSTA